MTAAYEGKAGLDYGHLIDGVADACAKEDQPAWTRLFANEDPAVPQRLST